MNYCAGYIRQQENQQLGIPPSWRRRFAPRLRELVGYGIYNGLIGHIDKRLPVRAARHLTSDAHGVGRDLSGPDDVGRLACLGQAHTPCGRCSGRHEAETGSRMSGSFALARARRALEEAGLPVDLPLERASSVTNEVWLSDRYVVRVNRQPNQRLRREAALGPSCRPRSGTPPSRPTADSSAPTG